MILFQSFLVTNASLLVALASVVFAFALFWLGVCLAKESIRTGWDGPAMGSAACILLAVVVIITVLLGYYSSIPPF